MSKITPGPWTTGKRQDGSRWLSLGDPSKGPHYQGDLCCSDADASLIIASRDLLEALKDYLNDLENHSERGLTVIKILSRMKARAISAIEKAKEQNETT